MSAPDASALQSIRESFDSYSAENSEKSATVHASIDRLLAHQSSMTVDLLRVSSIGKSLNQLRKKLPATVQVSANQLLEAWRKLAQAATQPTAAAATATDAKTNAASTPVKTPSNTTTTSSPPTSSPPAPSSSSTTSASPEATTAENRKRKAEGEVPADSAARPEKKVGSLAKSVIASIDYPLPTVTPPTGSAAASKLLLSADKKAVPLPGADAFFSKPPSVAPPMTAVAAAKAAIKAQQAPILSQRLSPVDEFRQRIRIQICKCFTAEAIANTQAAIKAEADSAAAAAAGQTDSTASGDATPMSPTAVTPTSSSTTTFAFVDPALAEFDSQVVETALEIEALVFTHAGKDIGKAYRDKSRDVMSHLRNSNNKELSVKVLLGDISVDKLITAPYTELASAALKRDRQKAHEWEMAERRSDLTPHVTVTDAFRCGKCRQRSTSFYQMQTRSADEPMTTFIRCLTPGCGNRWRC